MTEGEDKGADAGERFGESCGVRGAAKRPVQRVGGSLQLTRRLITGVFGQTGTKLLMGLSS